MTAARYIAALREAKPAVAPSGALCCHCQRLTYAPVTIGYIQRPSGPGVTLYACPDHVTESAPGPIPDDLR